MEARAAGDRVTNGNAGLVLFRDFLRPGFVYREEVCLETTLVRFLRRLHWNLHCHAEWAARDTVRAGSRPGERAAGGPPEAFPSQDPALTLVHTGDFFDWVRDGFTDPEVPFGNRMVAYFDLAEFSGNVPPVGGNPNSPLFILQLLESEFRRLFLSKPAGRFDEIPAGLVLQAALDPGDLDFPFLQPGEMFPALFVEFFRDSVEGRKLLTFFQNALANSFGRWDFDGYLAHAREVGKKPGPAGWSGREGGVSLPEGEFPITTLSWPEIGQFVLGGTAAFSPQAGKPRGRSRRQSR
ncbi:MAG: hypothetical protein GX442_23855 [Candidatus Riflebacteria bacterium]|nr:hypothetical protein [Candidatus Riflebacteria bacterium]